MDGPAKQSAEARLLNALDGVALAEEFAELVPENTVAMSAVQSYLIQHADSPRAALAECEDWLAEGGHVNREWAETGSL